MKNQSLRTFNQNECAKLVVMLRSFMVCFFVSLLSLSSASAQTVLQGRVTDAATGEPILFGSVGLYQDQDLLVEVKTNLDGYYYLVGMDPGTYEVEANYIGYRGARIKGVQVKSMRTGIADLIINEGIEDGYYKVPLIEEKNIEGGILEGKVVDADTGSAIQNAVVVLYRNGFMMGLVKTNKKGFYFFNNLDPGMYKVESCNIGYACTTVIDVIINAGHRTELNMLLEKGGLICNGIIIRFEKPLIDVFNTTSGAIFSASDISRIAN